MGRRKKQKQLSESLHARLEEALTDFTDNYVDPTGAYRDDDGEQWIPIQGGTKGTRFSTWIYGFQDESQLFTAQAECRNLMFLNEFALNAHENRTSYIVGPGHKYKIGWIKGKEGSDATLEAVKEWHDELLKENDWQCRQQEIVKRRDRDGEVFIRLFFDADGMTRIRFIDTMTVCQPKEYNLDNNTFGVETDPEDIETVTGYWVDGERIDATEIQHRKSNVDNSVKRGIPLMYPVRKNLRRAEKLLRNMSVVAQIQAAIAIIRKHGTSSSGTVQSWQTGRADVSIQNNVTGKTSNFNQYGPGSVLDSSGAIEYEFPSVGINASNMVGVLQAELRAIASRLVIPEFMLTSDASNANYSSTMVSEGPAVKKFEREQSEQIEADCKLFLQAMDWAIAKGKVPEAARGTIKISAEPPSLLTRDLLQEVQANQIKVTAGVLSIQTWCQQDGLDYEEQQENRKEHKENFGDLEPVDPNAAKLELAKQPGQSAVDLANEAVQAHWGKDFGEAV